MIPFYLTDAKHREKQDENQDKTLTDEDTLEHADQESSKGTLVSDDEGTATDSVHEENRAELKEFEEKM